MRTPISYAGGTHDEHSEERLDLTVVSDIRSILYWVVVADIANCVIDQSKFINRDVMIGILMDLCLQLLLQQRRGNRGNI